MAKVLAGLSANAGAVLAGGGMCAALALGAYIGFGGAPEPAQTVEIAAAPATPQADVTQDAPQPVPDAPATTDPAAPTFDELRRETDGTTIIAGRAEPLSDVTILLDGAQVARAKADSSGGFAAIAVLPPKDTAQVVSLSADSGEAQTASLDEIILAPAPTPLPKPEPQALPTPDPTPAPQQTAKAKAATPELTDTQPAAEVTQAPTVSEALGPSEPAVATQAQEVAEQPAAPLKTETPTELATQAEPILEQPAMQPEPAIDVATAPDKETPVQTEAAQTATDAPTEAQVVESAALAPAARSEPAPVAVLKSDAQGVQLLQSARPDAMTSVALDTIGYSDLGDVQLTGRAQPDTAKVRVYLDNRSVISLPVGADGRWRGDLPDVDEGIYTLRVDEVSTSGAVSSRVETPFKRESAQTLAQAAEGQDGPVKSITVQTGATLWAIARDRYGDGTLFVRVFEANARSIRNPDLIYPGQVFDLPN